MDTLNTVIDSTLIEINEDIISDLVSRLGYSNEAASEAVSAFGNFDLVEDAALNPVSAL